ncbi:hypothetical protein LTR70_008236 [Exophiala xenobiotica]|uniref:Cation transporter n=1 Tax=Lithohypha guttulata TaxID=1690604 RepID=A0ABR0K2V4_9EURO|nr:hypothetical protein LTR24_007770 [Lithohypha guttulata]KAK5312394.1 hypothetical protein LTR70_008236 [Exophiala xenobiotica]
MCNVGLNTVSPGSLNGFQQSVLFVLMLMGDLSLVTISIVITRRYWFQKQMKDFVQHSAAGRRLAGDIERNPHASTSSTESAPLLRQRRQKRSKNQQEDLSVGKQANGHVRSGHVSGYGGFPSLWHSWLYRNTLGPLFHRLGGKQKPEHPYLSFEPSLDHKGRFHSLTPQQEREIGGVEFRALKLLTWLLPAYAMSWMLLLMVVMTPYVSQTNASNIIRASPPSNLNPAWWSVFASVSAYTNCGLNLLDENMIPLRNNYLVLIFTGMAVLTGNTLFPVFLRGSIWLLSKLVTKHSETHHTLMFLLHHPRRCYPFLFPSKQTWILLFTQIAINLTAWVLYIVLNVGYTSVDPLTPPGLRVFQGLYQAHGLPLQFFYMVAMYIDAFPTLMSLRTTNVYEERSIGQDDDSKSQADLTHTESQQNTKTSLSEHLRRQLAYDLWWIAICVWLVSIIERDKLAPPSPSPITSSHPSSHSSSHQTILAQPHPAFQNGLFAILFETVSAYGNVGLSLNVPYDNYSFSGAWQIGSKLILIAVMLRGRHRILPMAIDRAVLLPGQEIMEKLDKRFRTDDETEGDWERDEEEIREEERGSDAEEDREVGKHGGVRGGQTDDENET